MSEQAKEQAKPDESSEIKGAQPQIAQGNAGAGGPGDIDHAGSLPEEMPEDPKERFLLALRIFPIIRMACSAAGINRRTAYRWREDPEFAARWEEAKEEAVERAEREAWRRAIEGVERPVFGNGGVDSDGNKRGTVQIGTVLEFSDRMLELILKAEKPDKYRERIDLDVRKRPPKSVDEAIEDHVAELERLAKGGQKPELPAGEIREAEVVEGKGSDGA